LVWAWWEVLVVPGAAGEGMALTWRVYFAGVKSESMLELCGHLQVEE